MAKVQLPDGNVIEAPDGASIRDIAEQIGPGLARAALAGRMSGDLVDLSTPVAGEV